MIIKLKHIVLVSLVMGVCLSCSCQQTPNVDGEWNELQKILKECTGEYTNDNRPKKTLTTYLTDAPILGNGEVGLVLGGDDQKQTFYLNRNDNWAWALGGVSISASQKGQDGASLNYKQEIKVSKISAHVNINGNPTSISCRVAIDEPLVLATITNKSGVSVQYDISTWSKPELDEKERPLEGKPFYLMPWNWTDGHTLSDKNNVIETLPFSYDQGVWPSNNENINPYWKLIKAFDDTWFIQNFTTNNFLIANEDGTLEAVEQLRGDNSGKWEILPVYMGFFFKNIKLGKTMAHHNNEVVVQEFDSDKTEHRSWMRKELRWQFQYPEGYMDRSTNSVEGKVVSVYRENNHEKYASRATISTRIIGGEVSLENGVQTVEVKPGKSITMAMAVDGDGGRENKIDTIDAFLESGINRLMNLDENTIQNLDKEREQWWKKYWLKCWVDLGNKKLNQYWYGAYHTLGCASRPGGDEMPSLWGPWVTIDNPNWGNDHYNNYNHISPYFGIFSGNRCELIEPYVENQMNYLPYFKNRTARAGYKGVVFPRVTNLPETMEEIRNEEPVASIKNRILLLNDQLDAAVYIGLNILFYYEYTHDKEFLIKKAYPFAMECIDFFEDYLEFENGKYVLKSSGAREGTGKDLNPAYPLGYIKKLCQFLIASSKTQGCNEQRRQKWNHILENISAYPSAVVNGKTVFKEAENREEIGSVNNGVHDNASRLQFIFPGEQIGLESDPKLLEIAHNSWEHLNSKPGEPAWLQGNNFPVVLPQVVRIGVNPDFLYPEIIESLETCFRNNLTVFISGGGIENCGATEAFNSMLMQSHETGVKLFPVWPKSVDTKFHRLRAKGAFLISSELKNGKVKFIEVMSEKGGVIHITNPWQDKKVLLNIGNEEKILEGSGIIKMDTKPGDVLIIKKA